MVTLLGVDFSPMTQKEYKNELRRRLSGASPSLVVTPNPEMLVASERDPSLKDVLNHADMRLVDGFGIVFVSQFFGGGLTRFTGVDALEFLCMEAAQRNFRVLLAGGLVDGDAKLAANNLQKKYPSLKIDGVSPGKIVLADRGWQGDAELKKTIENFEPHVLAVALGHGKQELWLSDHLKQFPSVRIGMGVGGAIEFLAGRQMRAPKFIRSLGLEWLYRLIRQPRRIKRILTAVLVFPVLVFWGLFGHN
ncbi:MAG: WecB/TagA/CpsF family glycosyltransferase [bacterium]|nr:WecB/TagA/CpsF family glycosyltransferase [bacterium]